jgi:hypothetical protein
MSKDEDEVPSSAGAEGGEQEPDASMTVDTAEAEVSLMCPVL